MNRPNYALVPMSPCIWLVTALGFVRIALGAPDIDSQIRRLSATDVEERRTAAEQLGASGGSAKEALPALITALRDSDVRVRASTAWALGKIQQPVEKTVPALIEILADSDWTVRHNAALSLTWVGAPAIPALEAALSDSRELVRLYAASALHRIDARKASLLVPPLDSLLDSTSAEVRFIAVQTIGDIGLPAATTIPKLTGLLSDKSPLVSSNAIFAVGAMGAAGRPAIPALLRLLEPTQKSDVRVSAITALANINQDVETWIPAALRLFLPTNSESVPAAAVRALAKVGPPALPHLLKALRDQDRGVRQFSTEVLALLGPAAAGAVPELIGFLNDPNWQTRNVALNALASIGVANEAVLGAVKAATADKDDTVQKSAQRALEKLGGQQR